MKLDENLSSCFQRGATISRRFLSKSDSAILAAHLRMRGTSHRRNCAPINPSGREGGFLDRASNMLKNDHPKELSITSHYRNQPNCPRLGFRTTRPSMGQRAFPKFRSDRATLLRRRAA